MAADPYRLSPLQAASTLDELEVIAEQEEAAHSRLWQTIDRTKGIARGTRRHLATVTVATTLIGANLGGAAAAGYELHKDGAGIRHPAEAAKITQVDRHDIAAADRFGALAGLGVDLSGGALGFGLSRRAKRKDGLGDGGQPGGDGLGDGGDGPPPSGGSTQEQEDLTDLKLARQSELYDPSTPASADTDPGRLEANETPPEQSAAVQPAAPYEPPNFRMDDGAALGTEDPNIEIEPRPTQGV
jgi:hypothetical protein